MYPFETIREDGQVFFHHQNWERFYQGELNAKYPATIRPRLELSLIFPEDALEDVGRTAERDVFVPPGSSWACQTIDREWSIVFGPFPAHIRVGGGRHGEGDSLVVVAERGHPKPTWGEQITLMSTVNTRYPPQGERSPEGQFIHSLVTRNGVDNFARFRGKYWRAFAIRQRSAAPRLERLNFTTYESIVMPGMEEAIQSARRFVDAINPVPIFEPEPEPEDELPPGDRWGDI